MMENVRKTAEKWPEMAENGRKVSETRLICNALTDVLDAKNADYGGAFARTMDEFGLVAASIRLTDKLSRFKQLQSNRAHVASESIQDTLLDMAGYCVLTLAWLRGKGVADGVE